MKGHLHIWKQGIQNTNYQQTNQSEQELLSDGDLAFRS